MSLSFISNKEAYANSEDQDQTAPEEVVWSGSTLCHSTKYFMKQLLER